MSKLSMRKWADAVLHGAEFEINGKRVNKGVLLSSAGGVLPPSATREFFQQVEQGSEYLGAINMIPVRRPTHELHYLSAAARQMVVATPGTAVASGTVTPKERTLTPTRALLPLDVSYDWIEDNADERDAQQVIGDYLVQLATKDLVDLSANGDGSTGTFLAINKGFTQICADDSGSDINTYDATNATFLGASGILNMTRAQMPTQYDNDAVFFMAVSELNTVRNEIAARATGAGDAHLLQDGTVIWQGKRLYGVPTWPVDKVIYTPRWNLVLGYWHEMRKAVTDEPRKACIEITVDMRVDFELACGEAAVYATTD